MNVYKTNCITDALLSFFRKAVSTLHLRILKSSNQQCYMRFMDKDVVMLTGGGRARHGPFQ